MSSGEWRIFLTKCVGESWENLVDDIHDKSISSSWDGTGLNLKVNGQDDKKWHVKMLEKYDGIVMNEEEIDNELNRENRGYQKLRAITMLNNGRDTAIPPFKDDDDREKISIKQFLNDSDVYVSDDDDQDDDDQDDEEKKLQTNGKFVRLKKNQYKLTKFNEYKIPTTEIDMTEMPPYKKIIPSSPSSSPPPIAVLTNNNNNNNDRETDSDDDDDKNNEQILVGLKNSYGNNCYQISYIQSMAFLEPHFYECLNLLTATNYSAHTNVKFRISANLWSKYFNVMQELKKLIVKINDPSKINIQDIFKIVNANTNNKIVVLDPQTFVDSLPAPFNNHHQQDVDEFIGFMNQMYQAVKMNSSQNPTIITSAFRFIINSMIKCMVCQTSRAKTEPAMTFKVCVLLFFFLIHIKNIC